MDVYNFLFRLEILCKKNRKSGLLHSLYNLNLAILGLITFQLKNYNSNSISFIYL